MLQFETILDKNDPRIYEFRKSVCLENGGSEEFLQQSLSHLETQKRITLSEQTNPEEVFKFGYRKWSMASFHSIEAVILDEKIVSISACEEFNTHALRVGMLLYTLKNYRTKVRDHMFCNNGFFSRHLKQAHFLNKKCVFLSVYPYNKKLLSHAQNIGRFKRSISKISQPYLYDLEDLGFKKLRDVDQFIIGYKIDKSTPWSTALPEFITT